MAIHHCQGSDVFAVFCANGSNMGIVDGSTHLITGFSPIFNVIVSSDAYLTIAVCMPFVSLTALCFYAKIASNFSVPLDQM